MQILGNIFNAIIFVSAIGGIFCVLSLFINHILRCTLPLWFPLCGMILFCVPFLSPDVFLISPETQEWLNGFYIACWVWVCGCGILFVYDTIRSIMAKRALKGYQICSTERLNALCLQCAEIVGLKKVPALYWGTLDNPICVTGAIRPAIIMSKTVIEKLTDGELSAVFIHELTHIKRKHILLERIYDYVYTFLGFILLMVNMYLHPLSSMTAIVMRDIPGVVITQPLNIPGAFLCIGVWGVASVLLAGAALKKRK